MPGLHWCPEERRPPEASDGVTERRRLPPEPTCYRVGMSAAWLAEAPTSTVRSRFQAGWFGVQPEARS